MNFPYLCDLVLVVTSVVAVIVVSVSANHKIEIDKKWVQGDLLAKSEQFLRTPLPPHLPR